MTKFQKIQKWLSLIPYHSTIFIAIVTYVVMAKNKAKFKQWVKYSIICVLSIVAVYILNEYIMTGKHMVLNFLASGALLFLTNTFLIELQIKCQNTVKTVEAEKNVNNEVFDEVVGAVVSDNTTNINEPKQRLTFSAFCKKHSIALSITAGVLATVLILGLIIGLIFAKIEKSYRENVIKDINGESDYSLAVITKEQIDINKYGDYSSFNVGYSNDGKSSDIDDRQYREADYTRTSYRAKSFNGIRITNATKTESNVIEYEITSTVESGNFAIMIYIDDEYHSEVNINTTERITLENVSGKTVLIKIIGEDANMRVEVVREIKN